MSLYSAIQWAPTVSVAVPFILGFFFVLGLMAQEKPRKAPVIEHSSNGFKPIKSNDQIIEEMNQ